MKKIDNRGFTLIEIVLSMAIFGIVVLGALSLFTSGILYEFSAGRKSVAIFENQQEMDTAIADGASNAAEDFIFAIPGGNLLTVHGEWKENPVTTSDGKIVDASVFLPVNSATPTTPPTPTPLALTNLPSLPSQNWTKGTSLSWDFDATGGSEPYQFAISGVSGWTVAPSINQNTGLLSGGTMPPHNNDKAYVTVTVTDGTGTSDSQPFTFKAVN